MLQYIKDVEAFQHWRATDVLNICACVGSWCDSDCSKWVHRVSLLTVIEQFPCGQMLRLPTHPHTCTHMQEQLLSVAQHRCAAHAGTWLNQALTLSPILYACGQFNDDVVDSKRSSVIFIGTVVVLDKAGIVIIKLLLELIMSEASGQKKNTI